MATSKSKAKTSKKTAVKKMVKKAANSSKSAKTAKPAKLAKQPAKTMKSKTPGKKVAAKKSAKIKAKAKPTVKTAKKPKAKSKSTKKASSNSTSKSEPAAGRGKKVLGRGRIGAPAVKQKDKKDVVDQVQKILGVAIKREQPGVKILQKPDVISMQKRNVFGFANYSPLDVEAMLPTGFSKVQKTADANRYVADFICETEGTIIPFTFIFDSVENLESRHVPVLDNVEQIKVLDSKKIGSILGVNG